MSKNIRPSINGFVPRRGSQSAATPANGLQPKLKESGLSSAAEKNSIKGSSLKHERAGGLTRAEIDDSLRSIEDESRNDKKRRKQYHKKRRLGKRIIFSVMLLLLLIGGIIFVKFVIASSSVFKGDLFGFVQAKALKQDESGFTNVILFGTSEDDGDHEGPNLTDSLMVLSVNQEKKVAYTFSVPRDLWVDYGAACAAGYRGKINALYQCFSDDGSDEPAGAAALQETIGKVTGLDIQYYAHVNYSVVREVVKAVDGVTVEIEGSEGDPGIMDSNFDWKCKGGNEYASRATMKKNCPPSGHFIEYPNGPAELDAEHALYLMMARGAGEASYGLSRSNFDRELNQQKIVVAIKEKALSAGTLTNLTKVSGLIDALGSNLRTNFETAEIRTLMGLASDIPSDKINSINLVDAEPMIFTNVNLSGQSAVQPVSGLGNYNSIIQYLKKQMTTDPAVRESATIAVYNGSGVAGKAQEIADALAAKGFSVVDVGNAPEGKYPTYKLYANSTDKPATKAKLESLYKIKTSTTAAPSVAVDSDFIVIVGSGK